MSLLGNLIWIIFFGLSSAIAWAFAGLACCITIVGIPFGLQCFKFANLTLLPFGRDVIYDGGSMSVIGNIIWLILFGLWMAIGYFVAGLILCITIIGIPFGLQCFKLAKLALCPFGASIV